MSGMSDLFTSLTVRDVEFRNRVAVSPMCQYSSVDGYATDWHLVHLGSRAVGGAALVFTEAAAVEAAGRISPADLGLWSDKHIEFLARIVKFIEAQGAVAGMQLAHAGRKASTAPPWEGGGPLNEAQGGWRPIVAPSAIPFDTGYATPQELNEAGIRRIVLAFADAARRALDAGFKVIELHAAHGYLIDEFLSPLSNKRKDGYGGSLKNRVRFLSEVVRAVRRVWPEKFPLFVRLSATDWKEGGWEVKDSIELARHLKTLGVDLIDCSSGGVVKVPIPTGTGYQTPLAERIRREAGIMTGAVGLITAPAQADHIIRTEQADMVFMARALLRNPYWMLHAAHKLQRDIQWPQQYLRAK